MSSFSNLQLVEIDPSKEELFPGITAMKEELQVVLNAVTIWKYLGRDLASLNEEPVSRISTVIILMDHTDDFEHSEFHCKINSNKN